MSAMLAPLILTVLAPADCSGLERRLWEVAVRRFERTDAVTDYPADSVLFYGSSSIRLWKTLEADMSPRPVIQRGYGGARLSDAVTFVDRVVTPHEFSALVVFVANDIDGRPNQPTPERVGELFDELLTKVRAHHPTEPVFWVEVTATPARRDLWPLVRQASDLIARRCDEDPNAYFVPTSPTFLSFDEETTERLFRSDGLHLSREGYRLWTEIITDALDQRGVPTGPSSPDKEPTITASVAISEEETPVEPSS